VVTWRHRLPLQPPQVNDVSTPQELPFDPDDPNIDPWADDPNAPKEPGWQQENDVPRSNDDDWELPSFGGVPVEDRASSHLLGPAALLDAEVRGEIEFEILFQQTMAEAGPITPTQPTLPNHIQNRVYLVGGILFAFLAIAQFGWRTGSVLLGSAVIILVIHEFGHWLALRITRQSVPALFLTPFLRNRASKSRVKPEPSSRALAHLAGPQLVVACAFVLQFALAPELGHPLFFANTLAVGFSAYSLLPSTLTDGGRCWDSTQLGQMPWAGAILRAGFVGILVMLGVYFARWSVVVAVAFPCFLVILDIVRTYPIARSRMILSRVFPKLSSDWNRVPKVTQKKIFEIALLLRPRSYSSEHLAQVSRDLHEQASHPCASPRSTLFILSAHLLGWLALGATIVHMAQTELHHEQTAIHLVRVTLECAKAPPGAGLNNCLETWQNAAPRARRLAFRKFESLLQSEKPENQPELFTFLRLLKEHANPDGRVN
jgi:hypothetical protein